MFFNRLDGHSFGTDTQTIGLTASNGIFHVDKRFIWWFLTDLYLNGWIHKNNKNRFYLHKTMNACLQAIEVYIWRKKK